ncbi:DUF1648 domain-containing protein [Virgibacillus oceani]|uniref:DUF1648 domain-containing protein n=1 Tax=Virgibacillus oceani TaxID=1479511 RepID=A0A917M0D1_9BACI|nr:DUF1648 domain-containing protein [Virgibacillus oceani]GGG67597.1 hypothetical protein GCM10011398_09210 [Virgibacillus oceani]
MGKHPKIDVPAGKWEKALNISSFLLLIVLILYVVQAYSNLPETIPTHFNANGEANGWGNKAFIFLMPAIALFVCFIPMYFLSKKPHMFNYMVKVTEENASRLYPVARLFMTVINFETVILFSYITWDIVQSARGNETLGAGFIVTVIVVPLVTVIVFMIKMSKLE